MLPNSRKIEVKQEKDKFAIIRMRSFAPYFKRYPSSFLSLEYILITLQ